MRSLIQWTLALTDRKNSISGSCLTDLSPKGRGMAHVVFEWLASNRRLPASNLFSSPSGSDRRGLTVFAPRTAHPPFPMSKPSIKALIGLATLLVVTPAWSQATKAPTPAKPAQMTDEQKQRLEHIKEVAADNAMVSKAEKEGVGVRLDALCHFRGTWSNQIVGVGLVTGLDRTGDSTSYTATQIAAGNLLKRAGIGVDTLPSNFTAKNIALVTVTCEIPPYSTPGQRLDVTVSAMGDASSLRNGTLIYAALKYPGDDSTVYATASGQVSVGGYSAQSKGNSNSRGFVTVGKVPGGAILQNAVPTNTVYNGKIYLDLDQQDITTAQNIELKIAQAYPELLPRALGAGTVEITLPAGQTSSYVQSRLMQLVVQANTEAKIVVDERSGTIVIGGNVRVGACAIARGSISVQIFDDWSTDTHDVQTKEENAQIAVLRPNTTVADLAEIFQSLKLKADDIIAILENLKAEGALKAKLEVQ